MNTVPGVDMSTGSLGQGVSAACGMALGAKKLGSDINVYTLLGDGEIEEGECWEAFMFANHYKLDNLCIMIDVNGLQIDGATRDVMNSEPLDHKMDAFGFNTIVCNGNSFADLEQAFKMFDLSHGSGKPTCFLLRTTKGLGVSYMENAVDWQGRFLYGEPGWLARQGPQRRRIRPGYDRAARRPRHAGKGDRVQQWLILKKLLPVSATATRW